MTMMNPIFLSANLSAVFGFWKTSILEVLKMGSGLAAFLAVAVLGILLIFQIFKAVAARSQNPAEFQDNVLACGKLFVGIALLTTYGSWSLGFFGG